MTQNEKGEEKSIFSFGGVPASEAEYKGWRFEAYRTVRAKFLQVKQGMQTEKAKEVDNSEKSLSLKPLIRAEHDAKEESSDEHEEQRDAEAEPGRQGGVGRRCSVIHPGRSWCLDQRAHSLARWRC